MKTQKTYPVVVQSWDESEAGWGVRSDGYSVHLTEEDRKQYCKEYWDRQPKGPVPHEYFREGGTPYLLDVTAKSYKKLQTLKKEGKVGLRIWNESELDSLRPQDVVKKEKEEWEKKQKALREKAAKEWEERKKLNEKLYGKDYDPNRGWRSL